MSPSPPDHASRARATVELLADWSGSCALNGENARAADNVRPESESKLIRTVSHALRHAPEKYFLVMDFRGAVDLDCLLLAMRYHRSEWASLTAEDLRRICGSGWKARFEISGNRIRALYGHSVPIYYAAAPCEPPAVLYHGTAIERVASIEQEGLRPMQRQQVHLTSDEEYAQSVAASTGGSPIVLSIEAGDAFRSGVAFQQATRHVWLADAVPPQFISRNRD